MPCYECSKQQSAYIVQPPIFDSLTTPVMDEFDSVDSLNDSTLSALAPSKSEQPQLVEKKQSSSEKQQQQQSSSEQSVESSSQQQKQQSQTCCCGANQNQQQQRTSTTNQQSEQKQTSASSKHVHQHLRGYQTMPRLNDTTKPKQAFLNQVHLNPPPRYLPQPPIQTKMPSFLPPLAPHVAPYMSHQTLINQATMINRYQTYTRQQQQQQQQQMMNAGMIPTANAYESPYCRQVDFQQQMPLYTSFQTVRQDSVPMQQQQQQPLEFDLLTQIPMYSDRSYGTPTMRRRNLTPPPMPTQAMVGMAMPPTCATPIPQQQMTVAAAAAMQQPQATMQQALMRQQQQQQQQQQQYNIDPSGLATIQRYRESSTPPANMNRISMTPPPPQQIMAIQQSPTCPIVPPVVDQEQIYAAYALQQQQVYQQQQQKQQPKQQQQEIPYQVYETAQIRYQMATQTPPQQQQQQPQQPVMQNGVIAQQCTFQPQPRNIPQAPNDYRTQMMLMNQFQQQQQQPRYQPQPEQLQQQQQQQQPQQQQQGQQNHQQIQILPTYTNFDLLMKELHKAQNSKSKNKGENNGEKDEKAEKIAANRSHKSLFQWLFSSNKSKESTNSSNKLEAELPQQFIIADFKYR